MPGACEKKGIAGTTKLSEAGTIWEDLGRSGKIWKAEHFLRNANLYPTEYPKLDKHGKLDQNFRITASVH